MLLSQNDLSNRGPGPLVFRQNSTFVSEYYTNNNININVFTCFFILFFLADNVSNINKSPSPYSNVLQVTNLRVLLKTL